MWPTESPWLAAVILSSLAVLWLSLGSLRGNGKLAAAGGVCALLAAGAFVLDALVVTDRERVQEGVVAAVGAFERGDREGLLSYFSPRALCERSLAEFAVRSVTPEQPLSLKDVRVELSHEDSIAQTTFRVNGRIAFQGRSLGHQPSQWRMTWRREGGEWRIIRVMELDPLTDEPRDRLKKWTGLCP
jgi:hypothetical protein